MEYTGEKSQKRGKKHMDMLAKNHKTRKKKHEQAAKNHKNDKDP